jgi:DNA-binding transcriptional MerR regulator
LDNFVSALVFIASQFVNTVYEKGKRLVDTKGKNFALKSVNAEIHALLCAAVAVFNNWPHNYFNFLEQRKSQVLNPRSVTGLGKDFAQYKIAPYQYLPSPQLEFMRAAFEEYVASKWDGGYVTQVKRLGPDVREHSRYISRKDAARILNMGVEGIDRLISVGKLRAVVRDRNNFRSILVERTSVAPVKYELEHSLYRNQVINLLGVTKQRIVELVEFGLLIPLQGQDDRRSDWRFSDEDVRALLANVEGKVLKKAPEESGKTVSFFMVLRSLRRVNVGTGMLVKIILEGGIQPVRQNARPGLASLVFLKSQVSDYIKELELIQLGDTLGVSEMAKHLGISTNNVRFLVKKGIVQTHRPAIKGRCDLRISRKAIDLFNLTYVLPAKVARQLHISPSRFTNLLILRGISPVSGPKIDGGMQYIFQRADITAINLHILLRSSAGEAVGRLNERKLVSAHQAAELLDIGHSAVLNLVERGILSSHRHLTSRKHKEDGPFFSTYTIEKYRERIGDYDGLVSSKVAAEMLGVSISTLNDRYVPKKLLHVALGGDKPRKCYFRLDDVKVLIKDRENIRQQCVTTAEAALICNVSQNSIHEWTEAGLLNPVSWLRADGRNRNLYFLKDVEKIHVERQAFKIKCVNEGKSTRFGRPAGPNRQPVRSRVGPRIKQLVSQWSVAQQGQSISGQSLRRHLVKEGYRVGINTIYVCLREIRQQTLTPEST